MHKALKCYGRLACLKMADQVIAKDKVSDSPLLRQCSGGSYGEVYTFLLLVGIQPPVVANLPHYLAWRTD